MVGIVPGKSRDKVIHVTGEDSVPLVVVVTEEGVLEVFNAAGAPNDAGEGPDAVITKCPKEEEGPGTGRAITAKNFNSKNIECIWLMSLVKPLETWVDRHVGKVLGKDKLSLGGVGS
jgi:hypothetical protein